MEEVLYNIDIINLSIGFTQSRNNPVVLREGINFSATHGEMVALIGGNGIGKSTLLRSLVGFQDYLQGDFLINGESARNFSSHKKSKLISFVSTEIVKVSNMTVFDLVAFGRFPYTNWYGKMTKTDRQIISNAILSVGMNGYEAKPVTQLSDGERQRAMIARALAQDTPIIILDEPTAFLDVSNKYEIFHLLQVLAKKNGKTIVLSTHDLNIALREVDKFWLMLEKITFEGSPEDLVLKGHFEKLFQNSHIGFDLDAGEYFFKKEFKEKVKIEGKGIPMKWTLRAFNRMGYQIVIDAKPHIRVVIRESGNGIKWDVEVDSTTKSYSSIYDIFRSL